MSAEPHSRISLEDYLAAERQAETKSEYLKGEVFAMSGASRQHNLIVWNLSGALYSQLRGRGCEAYVGDVRVHIPATGLYTYPDIAVVCGEPRFEDGELDTLLNPTLLIEVLSPSTEGYDRGKKAAHYRTLDSLREYVLVSRKRSGWSCSPARKTATGSFPKPAGSKRRSPSARLAARCTWRMYTSVCPVPPLKAR